MPKYNLKQQVNWREIMGVMRWYLALRKFQLEDDLKSVPALVDSGKEDLWNALELYRDLRKFLRFSTVTKMEKEIVELLEQPPEKK